MPHKGGLTPAKPGTKKRVLTPEKKLKNALSATTRVRKLRKSKRGQQKKNKKKHSRLFEFEEKTNLTGANKA